MSNPLVMNKFTVLISFCLYIYLFISYSFFYSTYMYISLRIIFDMFGE